MIKPLRILVTGATGFIGRHLLLALKHTPHTCCALTRTPGMKIEGADEYVCIDLKRTKELHRLPADFDVVVHLGDGLSALENMKSSNKSDDIASCAQPTIELAKWALRNKIRDFIYVSSVKAMCGETESVVLTEESSVKPESVYGSAKRYIENALERAFDNKNSRLTILRNPIVHGPGCRSNIRKLLQIADTPWPLPFKRIQSYRSTVSVSNCCDAIKKVIDTPEAPGGTYLIADNEPVSTGDIINVFRRELGRKPRLFQVPGWCWKIARTFPGVKPLAKRITGPLIISDQQFREKFGWIPSQTTHQSLQDMARMYVQGQK